MQLRSFIIKEKRGISIESKQKKKPIKENLNLVKVGKCHAKLEANKTNKTERNFSTDHQVLEDH